jgi:hypothetical protein
MSFLRKILRTVGDFFIGASSYSLTLDLLNQRAQLDHMLMLLVLGDRLGVPLLSPYYSLRLLPYLWPRLASWQRAMLRPKGPAGW